MSFDQQTKNLFYSGEYTCHFRYFKDDNMIGDSIIFFEVKVMKNGENILYYNNVNSKIKYCVIEKPSDIIMEHICALFSSYLQGKLRFLERAIFLANHPQRETFMHLNFDMKKLINNKIKVDDWGYTFWDNYMFFTLPNDDKYIFVCGTNDSSRWVAINRGGLVKKTFHGKFEVVFYEENRDFRRSNFYDYGEGSDKLVEYKDVKFDDYTLEYCISNSIKFSDFLVFLSSAFYLESRFRSGDMRVMFEYNACRYSLWANKVSREEDLILRNDF